VSVGQRLLTVQSLLVLEPLRGLYTADGTYVCAAAGNFDVKNLVKNNEFYVRVRLTYVFEQGGNILLSVRRTMFSLYRERCVSKRTRSAGVRHTTHTGERKRYDRDRDVPK
jgi:hypothetical protein